MSVRQFIIAVASLVLAATASTAQPSATTPRAALRDPQLDALVAQALQNAPEIASAQASVDAAQRRVVPARTLADPFLSSTYQNDGRSLSFGSAEGSFLSLMVSQAIPWPGKLRLAGDVAASEVKEIERGTVGRTALTLEARVRNAWYDLVLARAVDRIIEDRRTAATQIEQSVRDRYAAGLAVQQDVLRAQVELARIEELKASQAATIVTRAAELNRLIGSKQDRAVDTPSQLNDDAAVPQLSELIAAAATRSPELAASTQAIETGRFRIDLAKRNFLPDFTVNGGSMYRGALEMGPMWQVGAGISLPIWIERRQKNQLAEAQAVVRGRTADKETVALELELRTRERAAQFAATVRIAALYRDKVVPLDELSLESALASYQSGKLPFIAVLDALNTLYSDRAIYAGRLAEGAKWRVAIDEASLQPSAVSAAPSMGSSSMSAGSGSSQSGATPSNTNKSSSMSSMR